MSRYFFALWPDETTRAALHALTDGFPENSGRRIPAANLHITLVFLGNVDEGKMADIKRAVADVRGERFSLTIDHTGWWKRPKIFWAAPAHVPAPLNRLVDSVAQICRARGIETDKRPYQPHVSLVRKAAQRPAEVKFPPIVWNPTDFCLLESVTLPAGASYRVLETWPLTSS